MGREQTTRFWREALNCALIGGVIRELGKKSAIKFKKKKKTTIEQKKNQCYAHFLVKNSLHFLFSLSQMVTNVALAQNSLSSFLLSKIIANVALKLAMIDTFHRQKVRTFCPGFFKWLDNGSTQNRRKTNDQPYGCTVEKRNRIKTLRTINNGKRNWAWGPSRWNTCMWLSAVRKAQISPMSGVNALLNFVLCGLKIFTSSVSFTSINLTKLQSLSPAHRCNLGTLTW